MKINFLILIPAHNEEKVIGDTLKSIKNLDYSNGKFDVIVIADNCSDNTCEIVKNEGFSCFIKNDGEPKSKAHALKWFLENFKELDKYNRIVILDADTLVDKNFLKIISNYEDKILQSFVKPLFNKNSISSSLSGYSELLSQEISDKIKKIFNWSVVLRGTGMVFEVEIFKKYFPLLKTYIEDTELSILLIKDGYKITFVPEAIVMDPKPTSFKYASKQRTRWLYGQFEILKYYWRDMFNIMFSSIGNFFFISSIIFKPKTIFYLLKFLLLVMVFFSRFPLRKLLMTILLILISIDICYYLFGIFVVEDKRHYLKTMIFAPVYIIIWLMSFIKSLIIRGKRWTRAR